MITLMMDRPRHETSIKPEEIDINVVYEDDQLMIVNKEAGMVVHPGAGNFHGTLIQAVAWHLRDMPEFDANDPEVGLVHRIDKDTSGLLVVAKTPGAKTSLGKQFSIRPPIADTMLWYGEISLRTKVVSRGTSEEIPRIVFV